MRFPLFRRYFMCWRFMKRIEHYYSLPTSDKRAYDVLPSSTTCLTHFFFFINRLVPYVICHHLRFPVRRTFCLPSLFCAVSVIGNPINNVNCTWTDPIDSKSQASA